MHHGIWFGLHMKSVVYSIRVLAVSLGMTQILFLALFTLIMDNVNGFLLNGISYRPTDMDVI